MNIHKLLNHICREAFITRRKCRLFHQIFFSDVLSQPLTVLNTNDAPTRPFEELYVRRQELANIYCLLSCLTSNTLSHVRLFTVLDFCNYRKLNLY